MSISLKELKKNRLTPAEKWVLERIEGAKSTKLKSGNVEWYNNDGEWLFTQYFKNGELYLGYFISSILESKFELNVSEIQALLTNILYDYTDNGKIKIISWFH